MLRFLVVCMVLIAGCRGGDSGGEAGVAREDSAGVELVRVSGLSSARLPEWHIDSAVAVAIGTSEGVAGHDLHWPRAAKRLPNGAIAVANRGSNEVRVFDESGALVRSLGRRGAGPGEFESLSWAGWLPGDTILGYDPAHRRLTAFAPDGSVARTTTLPLPNTPSFPEAVGVVTGGRVVAYPGFDRVFGRGERRDTLAFMLYEADGARADTLGRYAGTERFFGRTERGAFQREVIFGRDAHAAARGDRIVIGSSDSLALDVFDAQGTLVRRIRVTLPPLETTKAERDAVWESEVARAPEVLRASYREAMADLPARPTYPAFTGLRLDDEHRIWIRLPARPRTREQWLVLAEDGTPAARVTTPVGLEIEEAGTDYVLVRVRDEDGVEQIRLHRLRRE